MTNPLASLLRAAGLASPGALAVQVPGGGTWTYADLDARSARFAHVLVATGVGPGDRVAVQCAKSADLLALHLACVRAGAVYLPLNDAYTDREVRALVRDAQAGLLVRDAALDDLAHLTLDDVASAAEAAPGSFDDVTRADDDPAALLYTSGTTGTPKGAVLSHANLVSSARTLAAAWDITHTDVLLHVLPLFHTHGLFVAAHTLLAAGGRLVMPARFDARQCVDQLAGCSVLMGVPTHYTRLLAEPTLTRDAVAHVRLFTSGSAPMQESTHRAFLARTGHTVLERYGMTETCMLTSNPLHGERRIGTVGPPLPGVEVRVVGEGTGAVEVRGPNVFTGYWGRPELAAETFTDDGWFRTGDLGRFDADGYLELVGRAKDLVITGGLNVHPKEVELVLDSLPGVRESAVFGVPDADLGEAVTAAVVAHPGATLDGEQLRTLARARLAGFKVPRTVHVLPELPRNTMGKVQKNRLRELSTSVGQDPPVAG